MYLSVSPEAASARAAYGSERYERVELQNKVREQFNRVATKVRDMHGEERWVDVDAEGSIEEVSARIWSRVEAVQARVSDRLQGLWSIPPL